MEHYSNDYLCVDCYKVMRITINEFDVKSGSCPKSTMIIFYNLGILFIKLTYR